MEYRKEVDGLRALAVLPVILFHAGFDSFSGGFIGVDIFFVISGYLITSILLRNIDNKNFSIIEFYERRARRILPALFFVMLVCLPLSWKYLFPADMQSFSQSLIAVGLFFSNFLFWHQSGYFDTASDLKPLLHTWSLSVEEQFYIILPILILLTWKVNRKSISYVIVFLFLLSFGYSQWASVNAPASAFFLLPSRAWELLAGSLVAIYLYKKGSKTFSLFTSQIGGCVGLILIFLSILLFNKETNFPGANALLPVAGASMVIIFANSENIIGKVLGNKIFVFIGLLSYSAYLWHQPIFAFARHAAREEPEKWVFVLLIGLVMVLAFGTWRFIERPFRLPSSLGRLKIFSLSFIFIAFFVVLGSLGHSHKGFESRFERVLEGDVGYKKYVDELAVTGEPCHGLEFSCRKSMEGEPDVVIVGDSHAEHLFIGLANSLRSQNVAVYYGNGVPYLDDKNFIKIFDALNNGRRQKVLITFYYFGRLKGKNENFYLKLADVISFLQKNNKEVILLADVPKFKYEAEQCIYESFEEGRIATCDLSKEDINKQYNDYDRLLKKLSSDFDIQLIDAKEPFYNGEFYRFVKDGFILYRDKHHLNIPGSHFVADYISELIK